MNLNGEQILDFIPEPALVIDNTGIVLSANELFLSQYGVKRRLYQGQKLPLSELIHFGEIEDFQSINESFKETTFTIIPTSIEGSCLLAARKVSDQYVLVIKDTSVEVQLHTKYQMQIDELALYSKGLEEQVKVRTRELSESNQFMTGMLDSLNQAILVLDAKGNCQPHHTSNCASLFKTSPEGKSFWDIIKSPIDDQIFLQRWISHLIKEKINFDDIAELGPALCIIESSYIELKYFPLRSDSLQAEGVVVVARDITRMMELEKDVQSNEEFEKILTKVATNIFIYRSAADEQNLSLKTLINASETNEVAFKKILHKLKGSYSLFSMKELEKLTHQTEEFQDAPLSSWKQAFMVLSERTKFIHDKLAKALSLPPEGDHVWLNKEKVASIAKRIESPYSEALLSLINMSLSDYILSYTNFINDLCSQLDKKIHTFDVKGVELPCDNKLVSSLQPILTLYFRNVVDHGFWSEENKTNVIKIFFEKQDQRLKLSISDSGRGLRAKSTETANLISGRGLGMQIIQEQLANLNGFYNQTFTDEGCELLIEMDWPN